MGEEPSSEARHSTASGRGVPAPANQHGPPQSTDARTGRAACYHVQGSIRRRCNRSGLAGAISGHGQRGQPHRVCSGKMCPAGPDKEHTVMLVLDGALSGDDTAGRRVENGGVRARGGRLLCCAW